MKYRILLNRTQDSEGRPIGFFGYNPGHKMEEVYVGEYLTDEMQPVESILEELLGIFNTDHPADYRNRSLSVGDVVILEPRPGFYRGFALESFGFEEILPE